MLSMIPIRQSTVGAALCARKARHLDMREVSVFGIISGPSLNVSPVLGQR